MLTPGDVVALDLGMPAGSEAGLRRPAIVVTAARILRGGPNVVQVVPVTRAIRTPRYKLIHHLVSAERQLFDLDKDPHEMDNLIGRPEFSSIKEELRESLHQWMQETNDPVCHGNVPLPKGAKTTDPDAFSPEQEPLIIGE